MRYAVIDVFYDDTAQTIARKRYDKNGPGYTLGEACDLMWFTIKQNPDTHYAYMVVIEG